MQNFKENFEEDNVEIKEMGKDIPLQTIDIVTLKWLLISDYKNFRKK